MTENGFSKWLETQPVEDKIVSIRYKYLHEKEWTQSNEVLEVDMSADGYYVWLNDWYEGQEDVEILGCIPVSDINVPIFDHKTENCSEKPNNCETCGTPKHLCQYCIAEDRMWTPKTEPQTDCAWGKEED